MSEDRQRDTISKEESDKLLDDLGITVGSDSTSRTIEELERLFPGVDFIRLSHHYPNYMTPEIREKYPSVFSPKPGPTMCDTCRVLVTEGLQTFSLILRRGNQFNLTLRFCPECGAEIRKEERH